MNSKENQMTARQMMNFIMSVQIASGILLLPNNVVLKCGHDGWITIILVGILVTGIITIQVLLLQRYHNQSIYSINIFIYGKYIGCFLNILILLYLYYAACYLFRLFINTIKLTVLKLTPAVVLSSFIMLPTCYLTWNGLKNLGRFAVFIYFVIFVSILLFIAVHKDLKLTFLEPVGKAGIKGILYGFDDCMYSYLGYGLISAFYPEITNKNKVMKHMIAANIISGIFMLITTIVCISFFGEEMLKYSPYAILKLSRSFRAPIVERIDVLFISVWFPIMFMSMTSYFSVCYYSINSIFNFKKSRISLTVFGVITILISRIPRTSNEMLNLYNTIMLRFAYILIIYGIITYILSLTLRKGVNKNE